MKNKKVLVVEDDKSTSDALVIKLEQSGFDVIRANDGLECLSIINENKPDIILMDLIMPKLDGIETLKKIRSNEETKDLPVIILTNSDSSEMLAQAMENDSLEYLIKSDHTLEQITETVKAKLEK
jgi:DNA-binding response OmpR family regulator